MALQPLSLISNIVISLIRFYQILISPILGKNCRFFPTCSQYGIKAIKNYGPIKGIFLILKRLLICHPFYFNDKKSVKLKVFDKRKN